MTALTVSYHPASLADHEGDRPLFGHHCEPLSYVCVCPRCGVPRYCNNIPVLFSSVICTHVRPVVPNPGTAPILSCETHPSQIFSITLAGSIEGVWTRGRRSGDCCVCVFAIYNLKFLEYYFQYEEKESRAFGGTNSHPLEELGEQLVGQEERCRAPLLETPPAESAPKSARV